MKQKLILTIWKAQFNQLPHDGNQIYCRLNYNNQSKNTKHIPIENNKLLEWKQTFVFPLTNKNKQQEAESLLRIDFIVLKKGEQIHYANNNVVLQTLSYCHAIFPVPVSSSTKGSLPAKLDILQQQSSSSIGKILIEYEILKTQISYLVQKLINYNYLLKLSNFKINFMRQLKNVPKFYLKLMYGEDGKAKVHKEEFPFNQQEKRKGEFYYNYPIKLYMNKEIELGIQLEVKEFFGGDLVNANESIKSMKSATMTDKRSQYSTVLNNSNSIGKKKSTMLNTLDIGFENKITAMLELMSLKQNCKLTKKIPLTTLMKGQMRDIGSIQFQLQAVFKTAQQKQAFQQQKQGILSPRMKKQKNQQSSSNKDINKKKPQPQGLQQSNGYIYINTIMIKLQLPQQQFFQKLLNKNISLSLKLGTKQLQESTTLQNPGKQLIFLDTFTFKRTWQQIIKITIDVHDNKGLKLPIYFASINLRELFQSYKISGKKFKIYDEMKQQCGVVILEMEYKDEEKKSTQLNKSVQGNQQSIRGSRMGAQQVMEKKNQEKRDKIAERMRLKQQEKQIMRQKVKINSSMSVSKQRDIITMAQALDLKDLILPPIKSRTKRAQSTIQASSSKRYTTLSPSQHKSKQKQKFRSANIYNSNGGIKFSHSPRFNQNYQNNNKSGSSFLLNRQSDFDISKKNRGAFIGYGQKYDFTKDIKTNPGIGKYVIPSLWDKYH